jgi:hypothetical protein
VQQIEIDGVTTLWEQGPEPLTGALVFGVGARHETFRTAQVTHLVEHLVMSTLPKSHLDHNASVDIDTTVFHATGRPAEVVDFLSRVCRALAELPYDHMAREAGVLDAEDSVPAHPALCWSLGIRYGLTGPGLLNASGPGARRLEDRDVREFVAQHFVRDNAVLILSGPPPEGLTLRLPEGPRPEEAAPRGTGLPVPALLTGTVPHPVLSAVLPREEGASILFRILADRVLDDVRHTRGLAYEVGVESARVDADHTVSVLFTDGQEDHAETIAGAVWSALRDLADVGPTDGELVHDLVGFTAYTEDPRAAVDWLEGQAYHHLYGEPLRSREEARRIRADVTREDVQRWARHAVEGAVLGMPERPKEDLPGLPDRSDWEPAAPEEIAGERFRRRVVALAPLDLAVTVGPGGIGMVAQGQRTGGSWDEVVGVAAAPGMRLVHLEKGIMVPLFHRHLRNADRLFDLVDERAGRLLFESTEDEIFAFLD